MPPSEGVAAWVCSRWKCPGDVPAAAEHRCSVLQGEHQPGLEQGGGPCLSHCGHCSRPVHKRACVCIAHSAPRLKKALRDKRPLLGALAPLSTITPARVLGVILAFFPSHSFTNQCQVPAPYLRPLRILSPPIS